MTEGAAADNNSGARLLSFAVIAVFCCPLLSLLSFPTFVVGNPSFLSLPSFRVDEAIGRRMVDTGNPSEGVIGGAYLKDKATERQGNGRMDSRLKMSGMTEGWDGHDGGG